MKLETHTYSLAFWPVLYVARCTNGVRILCLQWLHWRLELCEWKRP